MKDKESAMELLQLSKNAVENRLDVIKNRINNSYAVGYDVDNVFEVGNHKFDRVLYIKEFTRVQYTDTLIYSLKEILKIVHNMPARVIVMEPFYAGGKVQQYDWLKPHYSLTHQDILSGDILMLGLQKKVMEDILKNASNVSFLIVLDRTGSSEPYITGNNVINLYTVSDLADLPAGINLSYVISYDDRTLTIPYMEDFDKADSSKRLTAYSSLEITKAIISLLVR